jgi:F0F1-type ATP synthase assembly protein I
VSLCAPGSVTEPERPPPGTSESSEPKPLPGAVAFLNMGLAAAVCVGVGVVLGVWGDSTWHTSPLLLIVGLVLGLGAATWSVVSQIRRFL